MLVLKLNRASYIMKNLTFKVKITSPDNLSEIFKKYTVSAEINNGSPNNEG